MTAAKTTKYRSELDAAIEKAPKPKTDYSRWRLKDDRGRQTWHYLETDAEVKQWPMTTADKYHMGLDTVSRPTWTASEDIRLTVPRNYHNYHKPRLLYKLLKMRCDSSRIFSSSLAIGHVSMVALCSCYRVL